MHADHNDIMQLILCSKPSSSLLHNFTIPQSRSDKATREFNLAIEDHKLQCIVARFVRCRALVISASQRGVWQDTETKPTMTGVVQSGSTGLDSNFDTMPVNHHLSAGSAPSAHMSSQIGSDLPTRTSSLPASRRNSFDFVLIEARAQAANNAQNGVVPPALPSIANEPSPHRPTRKIFGFRGHKRQDDDFEDIELQEWPTGSRLAAMNSAIAALGPQTPVSVPSQPFQQSDASSTTASQPYSASSSPSESSASTLKEEVSLWHDLLAMFGAICTGKTAIDG